MPNGAGALIIGAMLGLLMFAAAAAGAAPPVPACTAATARRVTVADIGENVDRYQRKCVRVGGLFASTSMYGSVAELYLTDRYRLDGNRDPAALRRGRIGLYSADGKLRGLRPITDGIPHVEVIGIVDSCAVMYNQAVADAKAEGDANSIIMMSGYCHYYGGAVVRSATYSFDPPRRYERLLGEANRKRFGNLVPMPSGWADQAALDQAMADWREMIDRGDRAALRLAHGVGDTENDFQKQMLDRLLDPRIAAVRGQLARQSRIFLPKYDVNRRAAGMPADANPYATLCICRTANCGATWPIASRDADNHPSRPYVCTIANWRYSKGGQRRFETSPGRDGGLGEPLHTSLTLKMVASNRELSNKPLDSQRGF